MTYQIISKLLEKSEIRGIDATGYWGVEKGSDGCIFYHKEPARSSIFVKKNHWKSLEKYDLNLLLVHARGASKGVGEPLHNQNNHPFTNADRSFAMIHNGRVDDCEYHGLKQKYEVLSNCDSEILLRVAEHAKNDNPEDLTCARRLDGIKEVFSVINQGHMAVALGERVRENRYLWLFRNPHRPLWLVDLRDSLGQIMFFSEPSIWEESISECSLAKNNLKSQKLLEIPDHQIWCFQVSDIKKHVENVEKYEVLKSSINPWVFDGVECPLKCSKKTYRVVSDLDHTDQPVIVETKVPDNILRTDLVDKKCDEIIDVVNNIRQYAELLASEQNISKLQMEELLADLEDKRKEFVNMSAIINR